MSQGNYLLEHKLLYNEAERLGLPPGDREVVVYTRRIPTFYTPNPPYIPILPPPFNVSTATSGPYYHTASLVYKYPRSPSGEAVVWSITRPVNTLNLPPQFPIATPQVALPTSIPQLPPVIPNPPVLPSPFPQIPPLRDVTTTTNPYTFPPIPQFLPAPPALPTAPIAPIQSPLFTSSDSKSDHDWVSEMCGCVWYAQILADGSRVPFRSVYCDEPWCRWPVKYNLGPWTYTPTTQGWIRDIYRRRSWARA